MKNLVIIGNGFDIAHRLKTRYSDFAQYLCSFEKPPQKIFGNYYRIDSISERDQAKHSFYEAISKYIPEQELWNNFEEALAELDYNELMENNSELLIGYGDDNWRDSANHDYQYQIAEELNFVKTIPYYLLNWICTIDTLSQQQFPTSILNNESVYINFNYTDTLEKTYSINRENINYIHGKALDEDRLIVGHYNSETFKHNLELQFASQENENNYYENYEPDDFRIQSGKAEIKSYFRDTYKNVDNIIISNQSIFKNLCSIENVYVIGHSLSDIDLRYFEEIKNNIMSSCMWNVSYYTKNDHDNAIKKLNKIGVSQYHLFFGTNLK